MEVHASFESSRSGSRTLSVSRLHARLGASRRFPRARARRVENEIMARPSGHGPRARDETCKDKTNSGGGGGRGPRVAERCGLCADQCAERCGLCAIKVHSGQTGHECAITYDNPYMSRISKVHSSQTHTRHQKDTHRSHDRILISWAWAPHLCGLDDPIARLTSHKP
jgi:hypothetical protein